MGPNYPLYTFEVSKDRSDSRLQNAEKPKFIDLFLTLLETVIMGCFAPKQAPKDPKMILPASFNSL